MPTILSPAACADQASATLCKPGSSCSRRRISGTDEWFGIPYAPTPSRKDAAPYSAFRTADADSANQSRSVIAVPGVGISLSRPASAPRCDMEGSLIHFSGGGQARRRSGSCRPLRFNRCVSS
jgi:hypothetical protein